MKLAEYEGMVEASDDVKPVQYTIATNRKSFEVLSKNIYSDRVGAVIRELSTNAADANTDYEIKTGKPAAPFVVHLPNELEPYFSVEDTAVGMSAKDIETLYTTYFGSNRNTSNKFTGALGLGSKSPFAYCDQFTVISVHKKVERIFTCFVNEHGMPQVNLMHQEDTDKPNGVLVKVPVKKEDIDEFCNKAHLLKWFTPSPKIVGAIIELEEEKYLVRREKFGLSKESRGSSNVIMGNVSYRIGYHDINDLDDNERKLIQWGVDLWVDIGSVDIAANRETLSFEPGTVKTIKGILKEVIKELALEADKFLQAAPTIWQARRMLYDYRQSFMGSFLKKANCTWNGKKIATVVVLNQWSKSPVRCETVWKGSTRRGTNWPQVRGSNIGQVEANGKPIFIEDCHMAKKKIGYYMGQNGIGEAYVISDARATTREKAEYDQNAAQADVDAEDLEVTGKPPIEESGLYETALKASALPEVPKAPKDPNATVYEHTHYTRLMEYQPLKERSGRQDYWKNVKVDLADGGLYVVMCRFFVEEGGRPQYKIHGIHQSTSHPDHCAEVIRALHLLGDDVTVYGLRPSMKERIEKEDGWQPFINYVKGYAAKNDPEWEPRVISAVQYAAFAKYKGYLKLKLTDFDNKSPFGQFLTALHNAYKEHLNSKVQAYNFVRLWLNKDVDASLKVKEKEKFAGVYRELQDVYPLLKLVSPDQIDSGKAGEHLTQYITLMDQDTVIKKKVKIDV